MLRKAEKIKVPTLKLQWGVLHRIWQSDGEPIPRLCRFDSLIATFAEKDEAEFYCTARQRHNTALHHEFTVVDVRNLKAVGLLSVPEDPTSTGQGCSHIAPAESAEPASAGTGAKN